MTKLIAMRVLSGRRIFSFIYRYGSSFLGRKGQSSSKFQIELSEVNVYVRQ